MNTKYKTTTMIVCVHILYRSNGINFIFFSKKSVCDIVATSHMFYYPSTCMIQLLGVLCATQSHSVHFHLFRFLILCVVHQKFNPKNKNDKKKYVHNQVVIVFGLKQRTKLLINGISSIKNGLWCIPIKKFIEIFSFF